MPPSPIQQSHLLVFGFGFDGVVEFRERDFVVIGFYGIHKSGGFDGVTVVGEVDGFGFLADAVGVAG